MPPWFHAKETPLAMIDGKLTASQRRRGLVIATTHALRHKAAGRDYAANVWFVFAAALYRAKTVR